MVLFWIILFIILFSYAVSILILTNIVILAMHHEQLDVEKVDPFLSMVLCVRSQTEGWAETGRRINHVCVLSM